mgnify:CR=1 FL=1
MTTHQPDWQAYLAQMETVLGVTLDDARRAELQLQFSRIASMAAPLMIRVIFVPPVISCLLSFILIPP